MRREPHVRFCERAVVKFRRATHLVILSRGHADEALTWTKAVMTKLGLTFNEAKISVKDARGVIASTSLAIRWDHAIFPKVAAGTWAQAHPRRAYNGSRRKSVCC
jgi:hypothetical protein